MTTFFIEQFGCRATQADGAAIEGQLRQRGCSVASHRDSADVVVLNTCTVTTAADAQARDAIRKIHAANPSTHIIVTGCYAQRAPEDLAALPGVSLVVGNSHKPQIPDLVGGISANFQSQEISHFMPLNTLNLGIVAPKQKSAPILVGDIFALSDVLVAPVLGGEGNRTRPTLKIQDGCDSRCSFCVIPFVRGKSRSLPPSQVVSEVQRLSEAGYKEIVLSGINLGSYGRDLTPRTEFLDLLCRILDQADVERLRISSIEPLDVTLDLVRRFAASPRLAPHFHMPLQSASDHILARMHRWYRAEHYARRVELISDHFSHAAIGADVIAGFPSESEQDHQATLRFIDDRPFSYVHVFSYSVRPGTKAAALVDQVPGHIIKRRARELRALGEIKAARFRSSQLGRELRVLTLNRNPREFRTPTLSDNYLTVELAGLWASNQFVNVLVSAAEGNRMMGTPIDSVVRGGSGAD